MSEWRDIATAPKDGTQILVFIPGLRRVLAAWWLGDVDPEYPWQFIDHEFDLNGAPEGTPTQWQPFPDPPEASTR